MANQDKSTLRDEDNRGSDDTRKSENTRDTSYERKQSSSSDNRETYTSREDRTEGSDERTAEEIAAAQEDERLRTIDETEIFDFAQSSTNCRRAFADFDPDNKDVQPAEFWSYRDKEHERHGHF